MFKLYKVFFEMTMMSVLNEKFTDLSTRPVVARPGELGVRVTGGQLRALLKDP